MRSRFPDANWVDALDADAITPKMFDIAMSRAGDALHALALLRTLSKAFATQQAREGAVVATAKAGQPDAKKADAKKGGIEIRRPTSPRLEDLHVPAAFRVWCDDLVRDVEAHRAGRLPWSEIDVGCLLHGPPGTGKTMLGSPTVKDVAAVEKLPWRARDAFTIMLGEAIETAQSVAEHGGD